MNDFLQKLIGAAAVLASSAVGAAGGVISSTVVQLDATTNVPLGVAVTVGVSVSGTLISLAWWLSAKFKGIEDSIRAIDATLKTRPCIKDGNCDFIG